MASSHVTRTKKVFSDLGIPLENAQQWIQFGNDDPRRKEFNINGFRKDLFGFIDLIALPAGKIVAIQVCGSDYASHDRTILNNKYAKIWIMNGGIELWGWRKVVKKRGGRLKIWKPRIKIYKKTDFGL